MIERPILYSAEMVRALLREKNPKTMTRRVIKRQPSESLLEFKGIAHNVRGAVWRSGLPTLDLCPYGVPGDRLWVRETLGVVANWGTIHYVADNSVCYDPDHQKAGFPFTAEAEAIVEKYGDSYFANEEKRVPSIFMPRWASRISLEIVKVRVERVQDISGTDCEAEGLNADAKGYSAPYDSGYEVWAGILRNKYRQLWDSINAKRGHGWDKND